MNTNLSYYKNLIKKHFFTFFITFIIIFSLAIIYAYFAQRVYLSDATIEVVKYKQNSGLNNNPSQATVTLSSPQDEAEILKSNFLVNKAIENLNFDKEFSHYKGNKYFAIDEEEFPLHFEILEIKNKNIYGEKINIIPQDQKTYQVSIDTSSFISKIKGSENNLVFKESYKYGELIENENFRLLVTKKSIKE